MGIFMEQILFFEYVAGKNKVWPLNEGLAA